MNERHTGDTFDFIAARRWVFGLSDDGGLSKKVELDPYERILLLALIEHAPNMSPSISRLMSMTSLSRTTVLERFKRLEDRGVIRIVRSNGRRSKYELDRYATRTGAPHEPVRPANSTGTPDEPPPVRPTNAKQIRKAEKKADGMKTITPKASKFTRGTAMPREWTPNDGHLSLARELGVDLQNETAKFRDHALSKGRLLKDWDAGFRNWLRKSAEFSGSGRPAASIEWLNK